MTNPPKTSAIEKLKALFLEYGQLAIFVYVIIFVAVLGGFALVITLGFEVKSGAGGVGTFGAAWLATKVTQPLRIAATLVLTPLIARLLRRKKKSDQPPDPTPPTTPS